MPEFPGKLQPDCGEITGVLGQVSKYMEEPLKGVMEECAYEAQMTGNSSTALLAMAEKVEHPKFKELAQKSGDQYTLHGRSDNTGRQ